MAKYYHRIPFDDETYAIFLELKKRLRAETWNELAKKLLKIVESLESRNAKSVRKRKKSII